MRAPAYKTRRRKRYISIFYNLIRIIQKIVDKMHKYVIKYN